MRNPVACTTCRSAKQKCIHNDAPPCDRCTSSGRAEECQFPQPGTSAIHRRPKRPREEFEFVVTPSPALTPPVRITRSVPNVPKPSILTPKLAASLDGIDPFDLLTDEVINSYLRCSYKWSFHHTPTLLLQIRDRTLELWLVWAMLALAIRFVNAPPAPFQTWVEASNAFAAHARQILQGDLETPSISRVQALLMLTGHDWGSGNGRRAWIYLGMAIRLVEVMELTQEVKMPQNRRPTPKEFIEAEVHRRTAWTTFLMDSLLSGGKGRKKSLSASDMAIQLPCEREGFVFGEAVAIERIDGKLHMPPVPLKVGELGMIAYSLRAADIWGKVARWACSEELKTELPWTPTSQFQQRIRDLEQWKRALPQRLHYDIFSLHGHNAMDQGQAYCYMHCIHFMSYMFLHRAYLPVLGPHSHSDETPDISSQRSDQWKTWRTTSRRELFKEATLVLEMLDEMRSFGVFFLRGLVPWIGFTIYTAVGVMLYSCNFPNSDDDTRIMEKARERVMRGCAFLKEMKHQWPMSETWFVTIKRMQAYYRSMLSKPSLVSSNERQVLRRAMVDYGALQPSPVQNASTADSSTTPEAPTSVDSTPMTSIPTSFPPIQIAPNKYIKPLSIPPSAIDSDLNFDVNRNFTNEEMEDILMSATQEFWASFPGEVGV